MSALIKVISPLPSAPKKCVVRMTIARLMAAEMALVAKVFTTNLITMPVFLDKY